MTVASRVLPAEEAWQYLTEEQRAERRRYNEYKIIQEMKSNRRRQYAAGYPDSAKCITNDLAKMRQWAVEHGRQDLVHIIDNDVMW